MAVGNFNFLECYESNQWLLLIVN